MSNPLMFKLRRIVRYTFKYLTTFQVKYWYEVEHNYYTKTFKSQHNDTCNNNYTYNVGINIGFTVSIFKIFNLQR